MAETERWCLVKILGRDGTVWRTCALEGECGPDIGAVDEFASLALLASRMGGVVLVSEVSPRMKELLELSGLSVEVEG